MKMSPDAFIKDLCLRAVLAQDEAELQVIVRQIRATLRSRVDHLRVEAGNAFLLSRPDRGESASRISQPASV
jgi:hypothetical protein